MKINRIAACIMCLAFALIMATSVHTREAEYFAGSTSVYLDAREKMDFAAGKQAEYREFVEEGTAITYDFQTVNELVLRAGCATEEERQLINRQLEKYGVGEYRYLGYKWYGVCYYDSDFASFSTTAASYYIHTS